MSFYCTSVVNTPMLMVFVCFPCLRSVWQWDLAQNSGPVDPVWSFWEQTMSVCWPEDVCVFLYEILSLHALDNVITRLGETVFFKVGEE